MGEIFQNLISNSISNLIPNLISVSIFGFYIFFGLAVGSFLNCVIYRLEISESLEGRPQKKLWGRSFCPHCKQILSWQDLIPVLSFFILKGKCRYCSQKISWQYPVIEISTAVIFLLIFNFQFSPAVEHFVFTTGQAIFNQFSIFNLQFISTLYLFIISCFLIVIFVYDLKHYIIPDKVIYPAIGLTVLYQVFGIWNFGNWNLFRVSDLGFGILPSLFFLAIILISRGRWMGFGDFKLAVLMGLILGFPNILVALFSSFFLGAIIGVGLIMAGRKTLKSEVPFGPFLATGTFVALFWGEIIIRWYLQFVIF